MAESDMFLRRRGECLPAAFLFLFSLFLFGINVKRTMVACLGNILQFLFALKQKWLMKFRYAIKNIYLPYRTNRMMKFHHRNYSTSLIWRLSLYFLLFHTHYPAYKRPPFWKVQKVVSVHTTLQDDFCPQWFQGLSR